MQERVRGRVSLLMEKALVVHLHYPRVYATLRHQPVHHERHRTRQLYTTFKHTFSPPPPPLARGASILVHIPLADNQQSLIAMECWKCGRAGDIEGRAQKKVMREDISMLTI
jgi:hypothetical protein